MPRDGPDPHDTGLDAILGLALDGLAGGAAVGPAMLETALANPSPAEMRLVGPGHALGLSAGELFCLWLLFRVEADADLARRIGGMQEGEARHRPSPALMASLLVALGAGETNLLNGPLFRLPLARLLPGPAPMVLTAAALTDPMLSALGLPGAPPLTAVPFCADVPDGWRVCAAQIADGLVAAARPARKLALVLRGGLPADQRLFASAIAQALARPLIALEPDAARAGLGAALRFTGAVPFEAPKPAPGTRAGLLPLDHCGDLRLVALGADGGVEAAGWDCADIPVPALSAADRGGLWPGAADLPIDGLGPARLRAVAARMALTEPGIKESAAFRAAAGAEARADIEPHGQLVLDEVDDEGLVAPPELAGDLALLAARCRQRRLPRAPLGPAFAARSAETGVRALLSGPSGAGKTLACAWLATRLGMPLFRVDLSSVVSKYIGETEENLARILDRAEAADVILLFDEADSLFGARTEVKDSSDRFANNQTNYLLTRIENYGGIVLMTANGRAGLIRPLPVASNKS